MSNGALIEGYNIGPIDSRLFDVRRFYRVGRTSRKAKDCGEVCGRKNGRVNGFGCFQDQLLFHDGLITTTTTALVSTLVDLGWLMLIKILKSIKIFKIYKIILKSSLLVLKPGFRLMLFFSIITEPWNRLMRRWGR